MLDAAERLGDADARFVLVGDGPVAEHLRAERASRGLSNLEIRSSVPVDEVGRFLQDCDALLVPLRAHPLLADFIPSKLYDAMAVGRPVIVAAPGEPAALVREHGCGLEVTPEDGGELAAAVTTLATDPQLAERLGAAGRAAARLYVRSPRSPASNRCCLTPAAASKRLADVRHRRSLRTVTGPAIDAAQVVAMRDTMRHRGPDDEGLWIVHARATSRSATAA